MRLGKAYRELQSKLVSLIEARDASGERKRMQNQLEREFMTAWKLSPDRQRLGSKLAVAVRMFTTRSVDRVCGFDHCTYYTGENDQRIIVSQPYNCIAADITQNLTLDNGIHPEVIEASEWGFYYPGHADLFIVKFPFGFVKAMSDFAERRRRAEAEEMLRVRSQNRFDCEAVCPET